MPNYRRAWLKGGTYFFTVNLRLNTNARHNNDFLVRHIDLLREVIRDVRVNHPFIIHCWVVLPDHLHRVIELLQDNDNFAIRWKLIKATFHDASRRRNGDLLCVNDVANVAFGNADSGNI